MDPRILHFGLGNFHRAHQAVYTEAVGNGEWGIAGVAPRSHETVAKLRAQNCLYSVTVRGPGEPRTRLCHALTEALHLTGDAERVEQLITNRGTTVVTLTITEKGYFRTPEGRLDTAAPEIAADLAGGTARTVIGALVRGLTVRHLTGGAPLSVVSCDNMAANGAALHGVVREFAELSGAGEAFLDWLGRSVAWPSTVVDRIVPATAPGDADAASAALGLRDEMPVSAEPYRLWVLEDVFGADRPRWELDGALFVPDVTPYQLTKLRLLNGSHSALAYLGLAAGLATVADTMATDWGPKLVRQLADEVAPTLPTFGPNPAAYAEELVTRFENPSIRHALRQISSDGSRKLPERWFAVLRAVKAPTLELALAAWVHVTRDAAAPDPLSTELARSWAEHSTAPELVAAQLRLVGAPDLADRAELVRSVAERLPAVQDGRIEV
ncbi:mannitol dehydrogenase family protein [Actinoplanes sp. LDG1-06]|uniref:Mannitol dehydrogenase family protein n=1 Tax=Paractinoplanes ovalisporus TaxID=2810368 RepID=A0ABS2A4E6_9ACTN|nr:mannitol dehydrogenase family protein [Actinoplanes ovalisporus]MBM2614725.1 mannitol dehydrogenase family protein [Actinoplanes ovalisporus]